MAPSATNTATETAPEARTVLQPYAIPVLSAGPYKDVNSYQDPAIAETERTGEPPARVSSIPIY
jgi:molybdopterin biosynthesis enzyme